MKKILKWTGILLAGLFGLVLLAVIVVFAGTNGRFNKTYNVQPETVDIPTDAETIAYGEHVATIRGCRDCHGENLSGRILIDDPSVGRIAPPNLTAGKNGIGAIYSDADWERAIRHGVGPDGKPLLFMPSHEFYYLSDADLGALIAYAKNVPPANSDLPASSASFLFRALMLAGQAPPLAAEVIPHDAPRPAAPAPGVTKEYGEYLAVTCTGCHGPGLSGGPIPGMPPNFPPARNLTPGGPLANWSEEEFINTLRTGVDPDGHELRAQFMPWPILGQMTDEELQALWLYLQSIPAREYGNR